MLPYTLPAFYRGRGILPDKIVLIKGKVNLMAEPHEKLVDETEILDRAVSLKWNKFTWSGLLIIGIGCLLIVTGLLLNTGAYSAEGLLLGFGAIAVLIGIIRIFIGLINPLAPGDVSRRRRRKRNEDPILATVTEDPPER